MMSWPKLARPGSCFGVAGDQAAEDDSAWRFMRSRTACMISPPTVFEIDVHAFGSCGG